jgi:FixJ family two-component response regulator
VIASLALVSIVDDDESVRESLPDLLGELGFAVETYASAEEFLASGSVARTDCLLLDIAMPGMTGPELLGALVHRREVVPVIFITADADAATRQRMLALGAVECLFKPFSEAALTNALKRALAGGASDA